MFAFSDGRADIRPRRACIAVVLLLSLLAAFWHAALPLNHDVAWVLQGAGKLLDGARFGRDVVDVNPPMAWWIAAVPVQIGGMIGLEPAIAFTLFVIGFSLLSVWLTGVALRGTGLTIIARSLVLVASAVTLVIVPGYDFGQREHLMVIVTLPYLAMASGRALGRPYPVTLALCIGVLVSVGCCLKPHFLAIPALVELWLVLSRRSPMVFRPEIFAATAAGLLYLLAVGAVAPDYLTTVVPEAMASYGAYSMPRSAVVTGLLVEILPFAIGAVLIALAARRPAPTFAALLWLAALGSGLAAVMQSKGWSYHFLPCISFALLGCLTYFSSIGHDTRRTLAGIAGVLIVGATGLSAAVEQVVDFADRNGTAHRVETLSRIFTSYAGDGGPVYAFISSPRDVHPAIVRAGSRWVSEACCLHLLPAAIALEHAPGPKAEGADRITAAAARQLASVIAALERDRPKVIVVDQRPGKLGFGKGFDYLPMLQTDARFANLWKSYRLLDSIGGFGVFVRSDTSG